MTPAAMMISGNGTAKKNNAAYVDALAFVLFRLGRHADAEAQYRRALQLDPDGQSAALVDAWIYAVRGDANNSGGLNLGDFVFILNDFFQEGPSPATLCNGDFNANGSVNLGDVAARSRGMQAAIGAQLRAGRRDLGGSGQGRRECEQQGGEEAHAHAGRAASRARIAASSCSSQMPIRMPPFTCNWLSA